MGMLFAAHVQAEQHTRQDTRGTLYRGMHEYPPPQTTVLSPIGTRIEAAPPYAVIKRNPTQGAQGYKKGGLAW